jgi:hypothetical protein
MIGHTTQSAGLRSAMIVSWPCGRISSVLHQKNRTKTSKIPTFWEHSAGHGAALKAALFNPVNTGETSASRHEIDHLDLENVAVSGLEK